MWRRLITMRRRSSKTPSRSSGDTVDDGPERDRPDLEKAAVDAEFFAITSNIGPLGLTPSQPSVASQEPAELIESDEEFVPADPGPIPKPVDTLARFAWAGAIGGPILAILVYVLALPRYLATFASLAFVAGFAILIWRRVEERHEDDDGARL